MKNVPSIVVRARQDDRAYPRDDSARSGWDSLRVPGGRSSRDEVIVARVPCRRPPRAPDPPHPVAPSLLEKLHKFTGQTTCWKRAVFLE